MLTRRIALTAVKVALVVGAILNLVNRGSAMLEGRELSLVQLILNFLVPYCVSSYSAAKNELGRRSGTKLVGAEIPEESRTT